MPGLQPSAPSSRAQPGCPGPRELGTPRRSCEQVVWMLMRHGEAGHPWHGDLAPAGDSTCSTGRSVTKDTHESGVLGLHHVCGAPHVSICTSPSVCVHVCCSLFPEGESMTVCARVCAFECMSPGVYVCISLQGHSRELWGPGRACPWGGAALGDLGAPLAESVDSRAAAGLSNCLGKCRQMLPGGAR